MLLLPVMVTTVIPYLLRTIPTTGLFGIEQPHFAMILIGRLFGLITISLGGLLLLRSVW